MSALLTALGSGVSAKKILEYLMRKSPELAPKISSSLAAGLSAEKIVKWFSKDKNFEKLKKSMESEYPMEQNSNPLVQSQNVRGQNLGQDPASALQRHLPGIAGGTIAAAAVPFASRAAQSALSRAIPRSLQQMPSGILGSSNQPMSNVGVGNISPSELQQGQDRGQIPAQNVSSQPPVNAPSITQPALAPQPEGISNPKEYLEKHGLLDKVKSLLKAGNIPEGVTAAIGMKNTPGKVKGQVDPELLANVEAFSKQQLAEEAMQPEGSQGGNILGKDKEALPGESAVDIQKRLKVGMGEANRLIEKGSIAASPQGVGEVKEIRNGKAIIEVDGKKHKVNEDELESPSFSDDEVADAYDNLMAKIPEEHRSGFISWAGYDEDRNVLGFIPRGGKYEELHNITPEEAKMIKEGSGTARTSGENREGLWVSGEGTRGGVISQIIWDRKNANKSGEEKQLKLGLDLPKPEKEDKGMKPLFDEMAHARERSRERERKIKLTERERKKKEKDEAKKRKK